MPYGNLSTVESILLEEGQVVYKIKGRSMEPMLIPNKDIVTISFNDGGLICKNCYQNEEIVDLKMVRILRNYLYVDLEKISKIDIDNNLVKKINLFLDLYYEQYTGLYLQSKKFLKNMID